MRDDLLIAMRRIVRHPSSAIPLVVLLAIAMACVGSVFAVAYGLLSKPLPYPAQERLAQLTLRSVRMGMDLGWSAPYFDSVARDATKLDTVAGYRQKELALFDRSGRYSGASEAVFAEPELMHLLGARTEVGRLFVAEDAKEGAEPVALVSRSLAAKLFGGTAAALDNKLRAGAQTYRIIGVLPNEAAFPSTDIGIWLPMGFTQADLAASNAGSFGNLRAVGRLAPGSAFDEASAEMMRLVRADRALGAIADEIELEATAKPLRHLWIQERESSLTSILAAVLLVLAVTIANACSLFMLRVIARRQEYALFEAVGASRARRVSQIVCEAALVSTVATIGAAASTPMGLALLRGLGVLPEDLPLSIGLDGAFFLAMVAMWALATAALSLGGLALRNSNVYEVLRQTGNGQTASRAANRMRQALVIGQIMATFVLLFGTMLLMRSSQRLLDQDVGFDRSGRLVGLIQSKVGGTGDDVEALRNQIAATVVAIRSLPGVESVALSSSAPFSRTVSIEAFRPKSDGGGARTLPSAYVSYVSWEYADAAGLPLKHGRAFTEADAEGKAPIALVDEDLAAQYFAGASAVGRTIGVNDSATGELVDVTIVGVVGTVRQRTLSQRDEYPSIYLPEAVPFQVHGIPTDSVELVIRTDRPAATADVVRGRVEALAPALRIGQLISMERRISDTIVDQIRLNRLLQLLGGVTILLTLAGLYALLARSVAMRTREFGVRLALGATRGDLVASVFKLGARMVVLALGLAIPLGLVLGTILKPRLFETSPFDPLSLVVVAGLLLLVQCLATVLPAFQSSRVQPMEALRSD